MKFTNIAEKEYKNILKRMKNKILIIAVTDIERDILFKKLSPIDGENNILEMPYKSNTYYVGKLGIQEVSALIVGMGAISRDSTMNKINEAIDVFKPNALIMVGIAFGMDKNKQKIGDVLISQRITAYEPQKLKENSTIYRGDSTLSGKVLFDRLKNSENWVHHITPKTISKKHFGTILSGEKLFDSKTNRDEIYKAFPEAIGGEMEGYGLASVSSFKGVNEWIIIKGICDWGFNKQGNNKDLYQNRAMEAALSLCEFILSEQVFLNQLLQNAPIEQERTEKRINSYKMFFYRINKKLTLKDLSKITGLTAYKLKKMEKINIELKSDDIYRFPLSPAADIRALENALGIKKGGLIIREYDLKNETYKKYYEQNKGLTAPKRKKKNAKIVVFDFDGTIVDAKSIKTTWQKIWIMLGYDASECNELHKRYDNNEITHQEWCDITAKRFKEKGLTKQQLLTLAQGFVVVPGFYETISHLKASGIRLYIVSGSIHEIIINVLTNCDSFDEISANKFVFHKQGLLSRIIGTKYDFDGKAKFVEKVANECQIPTDEILFIGNSFNDAHVYKSGARTLCINPTLTNSHNTLYWHDAIDEMKNFNEILPFVFPENDND